jgi:LysR family hydrogen peroxide-inducible transcriptional activator
MRNLPTLRQMQYLAALASHGSFRRAADSCHVTQSTLSAGLQEMEETMGAPLVDRSNRRAVRFTPLGDAVVRESRDILERAESLLFKAQSEARPLSWPLRLGVIPTIAPYFLPKILKPLQRELPALDLHIHELRSAPLREKVEAGELDCGLMAFPYDTGMLAQSVLFEEEFVCAAPPGAFRNKKKLTMADLSDQKLLLLEDGHCVRDHALAACKLQPVNDLKTLSAASLSTLIQMVHQGYGLTLLPAMAAEGNAFLPRNLTLRHFSSGAPKRKIGLAYQKNGLRASDISLVASALRRILKA